MTTGDRLPKWPMVGRQTELDLFSTVVTSPGTRGFVVSGPAGVGKTRLAVSCLDLAAGRGFSVAQATASTAAASVPLGAVAHLIPADVDLSDPVRGFAAVAGALGRTGKRWVLLVDDVHLLDTTSAVLLRQLMDARVVRLLATIRTGEPIGDPVRALIHEDAVHRVDMGAFDLAQTDQVLQASLGAPVGRRTLTELFTASGGNALYLRELVLGAVESGALAVDGEVWELREGQLPATRRLTELIEARLSTTGEDDRKVLERLAVCGALSVSDLTVSVPLDVVDRLERVGLVEIVEDRRRVRVRLAHPLYGEVIRAGLSEAERHALLEKEAERIEAHGARRRDDALHVAGRLLTATGTADPELLLQAANLARHSHDYPQVVALLDALPPEHRGTGTRLLKGDAFYQMGRWMESESVLAEASAMAEGEEEVLSVVMTRVDNLLWSKAPLSAALAANSEAMARVTSDAAQNMLHINEGYILVSKGRFLDGLARLDGLEEDFSQVADVNAWLRGALMRPFGLALIGRTEEAAVWAERAYDAHMLVDKDALVSHPAVQKLPWILALCEGGQLSRAASAGETTYYQLGAFSAVVRVWLVVIIARSQWIAGHPASARRWYAEAIALGHTIDNTMTLRSALSGLAACAAVLGDIEAAQDAVTELETLPDVLGFLSGGELQLGPAWLAVARGDVDTARALLTEGARLARDTGHITGESLLLTEVARLGGAQEVAARLDELAALGDGGELLPARALLANALADKDAQALRTAADTLARLGADLTAAEAYAAAAAALRAEGQSRAATEADNRSADLAQRCEGATTPLLVGDRAPAQLTDREREIAVSAASGSTSKDIAQALTLSVRTVNNHLQRIYGKLGVTTRRELAEVLGLRPPS